MARTESGSKSEVFVKDQETEISCLLGFSIETTIRCQEGHHFAIHTICDVLSSRGDGLGLREGDLLLKLNKIKTDGMDHITMLAQFKAIDLDSISMELQLQNGDIKMFTVKCCIDTEGGAYTLKVTEKSLVDMISARSVQILRRRQIKSQTEKDRYPEERNCIEVAYPKQVQRCYIQHPASKLYLQVERGRLIMSPIRQPELHRDAAMYRALFCGYEGVDSSGPEGVIICTFRETVPEALYICATTENTVGIQNIKIIPKDIQILNTDDPRLFYHSYAGIMSVFKSTSVEDHYLAYCDGRVRLKNVDEDNISNDSDIQFILRYDG